MPLPPQPVHYSPLGYFRNIHKNTKTQIALIVDYSLYIRYFTSEPHQPDALGTMMTTRLLLGKQTQRGEAISLWPHSSSVSQQGVGSRPSWQKGRCFESSCSPGLKRLPASLPVRETAGTPFSSEIGGSWVSNLRPRNLLLSIQTGCFYCQLPNFNLSKSTFQGSSPLQCLARATPGPQVDPTPE